MVATDVEIPEELIKDLPASITRGQLKQAWKARELIWRLTSDGKSPYQVSPNVHVPVRVVEYIARLKPPSSPPSEPRSKGGPHAALVRATPAGGDPADSAPTASPASSPVVSPTVSPSGSRDSSSDSPFASPSSSPASTSDSPFARRDPTASEIDRARALTPEMEAMHRAGSSFSQIARKYRLPIATVESMIGGPQPTENLWSPSWSSAEPGPMLRPDDSGGWEWRPSGVGRDVIQALKDLGAKGNLSAFIVRRWEMGELSPERLEQIVYETGSPKEISRSIASFVRERAGESLTSPGRSATDRVPADPLAEALRAHRQHLADQLVEADAKAAIARAEREARGEPQPQGESSRVVELEKQIRELQDRLRAFETVDAVNRATSPLHERIRTLENSGKSREAPAVEAERMSNTVRNDAQSRAVDIASTRLERAPTLMQLAQTERGRKAVAVLDRRLDKWAKEEGIDLGGTLVEQSAEDMARVAAELERGLAEQGAPDGASAESPNRLSFPSANSEAKHNQTIEQR